MSQCYWCGVDPCIEPRTVSGFNSCAVCRELDRLRGICTLIPAEHHSKIVSELRLLSGRLREWQKNRFGGPPEGYNEPPPQPELSFAQGIKVAGASSSKPPEPSGPPPSHLRVDSSHSQNPERAERPAARKRKKKNRGQSRAEWQRARGTVVRSRLTPLDQSGSEVSSDSNIY